MIDDRVIDQRAVYECDACGTVLSARITRCPGCGEEFDEPVPAEAASSEDVCLEPLSRESLSLEPLSLVPVPRPRNPLKIASPLKLDDPPKLLLPEKICPQCSLITPLSSRTCRHCGHRYRTQFLVAADGTAQPFDPNRTQMFVKVQMFPSVPIITPVWDAEAAGRQPAPLPGLLREHSLLRTRRNKGSGHRRWMLIGLGLLLCAGAILAAWDLFW